MNIVEFNRVLLLVLEEPTETALAIQVNDYREIGIQTILDIVRDNKLRVEDIEYTGDNNENIVIMATPTEEK